MGFDSGVEKGPFTDETKFLRDKKTSALSFDCDNFCYESVILPLLISHTFNSIEWKHIMEDPTLSFWSQQCRAHRGIPSCLDFCRGRWTDLVNSLRRVRFSVLMLKLLRFMAVIWSMASILRWNFGHLAWHRCRPWMRLWIWQLAVPLQLGLRWNKLTSHKCKGIPNVPFWSKLMQKWAGWGNKKPDNLLVTTFTRLPSKGRLYVEKKL